MEVPRLDNSNNNLPTNPSTLNQQMDLARIYGMNIADNNLPTEGTIDDYSLTPVPSLNQDCANCAAESLSEVSLQFPQLEPNDMNITMPRAGQSSETQRIMQQNRITTPQRQIEQTLPITNPTTSNSTGSSNTTTSSEMTSSPMTISQPNMLFNENVNGSNIMNLVNPCGDMNNFLRTQIGKVLNVQFLLGTNALVEKTGVLLGVGSNYIVLRDSETNDLILCNFDDIKFIRFENNTQ